MPVWTVERIGVMARQVDERVDWVRRRASLVVWALAREAVSWRRERGGISAGGVGGVGGAAAVGAVEGMGSEERVRLEMEERQ